MTENMLTVEKFEYLPEGQEPEWDGRPFVFFRENEVGVRASDLAGDDLALTLRRAAEYITRAAAWWGSADD